MPTQDVKNAVKCHESYQSTSCIIFESEEKGVDLAKLSCRQEKIS